MEKAEAGEDQVASSLCIWYGSRGVASEWHIMAQLEDLKLGLSLQDMQ